VNFNEKENNKLSHIDENNKIPKHYLYEVLHKQNWKKYEKKNLI